MGTLVCYSLLESGWHSQKTPSSASLDEHSTLEAKPTLWIQGETFPSSQKLQDTKAALQRCLRSSSCFPALLHFKYYLRQQIPASFKNIKILQVQGKRQPTGEGLSSPTLRGQQGTGTALTGHRRLYKGANPPAHPKSKRQEAQL